MTCKNHLVCDGRGRVLSFVLTGGQVADTIMLPVVYDQVTVQGSVGRPRTRPQRVLADKGYPSKANRSYLRSRGIATTIPERADQIAHRRKRRGRPIDFGAEQYQRYRGRNVVERCFNRLKQWRGVATRCDKTAGSYHAGVCLAATLDWMKSAPFSNTPYGQTFTVRMRGRCRPSTLWPFKHDIIGGDHRQLSVTD